MSSILRNAALLAACAVAGCGSGAHDDPPPAGPILNHGPTGQGLAPTLPRHPLLDIQRIGDQAGTSDKIVYGRDGHAVLIRAYGGGGFYSYRCALTRTQLASLRAAVGALPLDRAPKRHAQHRDSYYQQYPATFVVRAGGYTGSFTKDAMPRDARPLVRHMVRTITGHEGRCHETFGQRSR